MDRRSEVLRLLMEHRGTLFSFIYAMVRDFEVAEDIFQEVSVAVCESCADFRPGTNFGAWTREIARRRVLAHQRTEGRFPGLLSDEELAQIQAGFDEAESGWCPRDRLAALRQCVDSLSPAARRLLELRYAGRFRLSQIADQLGRQSESVRKALYRTRETLRACIERRMR
ncbi:MAG: sigma-70 family RNA polymerase sigma factor, partial [Planctomycetota bacterium]